MSFQKAREASSFEKTQNMIENFRLQESSSTRTLHQLKCRPHLVSLDSKLVGRKQSDLFLFLMRPVLEGHSRGSKNQGTGM